MTRRTSIVEQIGVYFASKGKVLTAEEYKAEEDVPVRFQLVKRNIGSWSRLLNMVGDITQYSTESKKEAPKEEETPKEEEAPKEEAPKEETPKEESKPTKG